LDSLQGCTIDWKAGKDTTKVVVERRQKHKRTGSIRTISKTERRESFFNFFNPPTPPDEQTSEEAYDDIVEILNEDFEIGEALRERIIPRAVLYYTGEALDDESDVETESEEEEEEDEDEGNQSQEDDEIAEQGDGN
jgi:nucleosome assembly protein 1-like 1